MKTLIFGAGNCGRLLAEKVLANQENLVGFIDNDPAKIGKNIAFAGGGDSHFFY